MHFSRCRSALVVKLFEKYLWWSAIFSKFACNVLQLCTTAAETLYFIIALINAEQLFLQNTSRKLLIAFGSSRSQILFKISVLKNFATFTGKHHCWSLFLIKLKAFRLSGLQLCYKRLQHSFYLVKFAKVLRTSFFTEYLFPVTTSMCYENLGKRLV